MNHSLIKDEKGLTSITIMNHKHHLDNKYRITTKAIEKSKSNMSRRHNTTTLYETTVTTSTHHKETRANDTLHI